MRKLLTFCALAASLSVFGGAASAQVTGLWYAEEERDGRIYIFNTAERHAPFADLYFFKHGLPGYDRPTPSTTPPFTVGWKNGKTTIESRSARLVLSNRAQIRYTQQDPENGDDKGSFRLRRMKTKFEGWVYDTDLTYELQLNWADSSNSLEDANVNYDFTDGKKALQLKLGQFKAPFGRQELTSSGSQQFVDRSAVSNTFARGRDLGLQVHGLALGGAIDWRAGVFNGEGRNQTANLNDEYQFDARVAWQPFGDVKYSESDFESSDRPLFALAAQVETNDRRGTTGANDQDRETVGADAVFKYRGFSLFGELFDADVTPETGGAFSAQGWNLQAGYFLIPRRLELALRFAELDPTDAVADDEQQERGLAVNWFFNQHPYKLQADYRQLENEATGAQDDEVRLQYQLIF